MCNHRMRSIAIIKKINYRIIRLLLTVASYAFLSNTGKVYSMT